MTTALGPVLLIDGHNLLCRSAYAFQELATSDGRHLGGLFGFVKSFLRVAGFYQGTYRPLICWDCGRSDRRMTLAPDYKERPRMELFAEPISDQVKMAEALCGAMGVLSIKLPGVEADDTIAVLSRLSRRSVIYSTDKDFFQLVREGHKMRRPTMKGEQIFEYNTREHFTGLKARLYLALMGDKADNIPGVPGVGETTAKKLLDCLEVHPTLDYNAALQPGREPVELLRLVEEALVERRKGIRNWKKVTQHWDSFIRSLALVDLWRDDLLTEEQLLTVMDLLSQETEADWDKVQAFFDDYEFSFTIAECKSMLLGETLDLNDLWDDSEPEETPVYEPMSNPDEHVDPIDNIMEDLLEPAPLEALLDPSPQETPEPVLEPADPEPAEPDPVDDLLEDLLEPEELPEEPETKARFFSLAIGYVEDASLSNLFIAHDTGFDSVEEALEDFGQVLLRHLTQAQDRVNKNWVKFCPHCKKALETAPVPSVEQLTDLFLRLFYGTNDSAGDLWDTFDEAGWRLSPSMNYARLAQMICVPENAETLIGALTFPEEPPDRFFSWADILLPPGVRLRKASP